MGIITDAPKMDPRAKKLWLEALRSGEYRQGKNYLAVIAPDGSASYCCLGVLCEVAIKAGLDLSATRAPGDSDAPAGSMVTRYGMAGAGGSTAVLPGKVGSWAGIDAYGTGPAVWEGDSGDCHTLAMLNDEGGYTFEQIADVIEQAL